MKYLTLLALLIQNTCLLYSKDQIAEVTFYDSNSKMHLSNFPYYIDTSRIQYGVKFGVTVYEINVFECNLEMPQDIEEYFAAYLKIPNDCDVQELLKEIENHGADFIFLDLRDHFDFDKIESNKHQNPVFVLDNTQQEEFFNFSETKNGKRYVTIFSHMVN